MINSDMIVKQVQDACLTTPGILTEPRDFRAGNGELIRYSEHFASLKQQGHALHPFFGNCFRMASTVYYALGSYKAGNELMKAPRFEYHDGLQTTHWVVKTNTGEILDPSWEQFLPFPEVTKEMVYSNLVKAHIGFPYFVRKGGKRYNEVVPNKVALKIGLVLRERHGTAYGLDHWLAEREEQRGLDDLYKAMNKGN